MTLFLPQVVVFFVSAGLTFVCGFTRAYGKIPNNLHCYNYDYFRDMW